MGSGTSKQKNKETTKASEDKTKGREQHNGTLQSNQSKNTATKAATTAQGKKENKPHLINRNLKKSLKDHIADEMKKLKKRISVVEMNPKDVTSVSDDRVLMGDLSVTVPNTAKIVRIFTSSTFTDTRTERNYWMKNAYPELQKHCRKKGYQFQVVDMRWGVRDDAADDNTTTELCLKEIKLCQQLSTGPNFITLLAQKYGFQPIPRTISSDEFEMMVKALTDEEEKELLTKWYIKDENADPSEYVLCRRSKVIPNYDHSDRKMSSQVDEIFTSIRKILKKAAEIALKPEDVTKYNISVTEIEIHTGMLETTKPGDCCLWYHRDISDLDQQVENARNMQDEESKKSLISKLERYKECTGDCQEANDKLQKLKEEKIMKHLPSQNIRPWSIKWCEGEGVYKKHEDHKEYLKKMTTDFVERMRKMIDVAVEKRAEKEKFHPLYTECLQHIKFAQTKCEHFVGMEHALQKIKNYLLSKRNDVLVVHGNSGSGKTSLMARTAQLTRGWFGEANPAVVLRFIGTTPESSNLRTLLTNIITQIRVLYGIQEDMPESLNDIIKETEDILDHASSTRPLVIILDSLDQLDAAHNAISLFWLPTLLPPYVKIIVSTIEEINEEDSKTHECFENLKVMFSGKNNFVPVGNMESSDIERTIDKWLKARKRCLTNNQRNILMKAYNQCPSPLFLKLSVDEASQWQSHWPSSETVLQKTVQSSIRHLFQKLETSHGEKLVTRALGYLTASRNGLSEGELEDILSCDDDVLRDVYQYSKPPIIRLPPLLLVRLRNDLQGYIVERGADGVTVMYWYHRQFLHTAKDRYITNAETEISLHTGLAEFFMGKWSQEKKAFCDKKKQVKEKNRHVSEQPLKIGEEYNYRKLNNLPFHLARARMKDLLKKECLLNFTFLHTKLLATSVSHVLNDYTEVIKLFEKDADIKDLETVRSSLMLSSDALMYDPNQLAPQLLDRLSEEQKLKEFLMQCKKHSRPFLMPDHELQMKPGGQLVHCLTGHHGPIISLDVKQNGSVAVTCADDDEDSVKTWDIIEGKLLKSYDGLGRNPTKVKFVMNDSLLLVRCYGCFIAIKESREKVYEIMYEDGVNVVAQEGKTTLCAFTKNEASLYSLKTGECLRKLEYPSDEYVFCEDSSSCVAVSGNCVVLTHCNKRAITQFDVATDEFTEWTTVFDAVSELTVDAVVLSPDDNTIILSNAVDNDLHFYKRENMDRIATIKGNQADFAANYKLFPDTSKLYFANNSEIVVWDILSKKRSTILSHPREITDCISVSHRLMVTVSDDEIVRVWDLERTKNTSNHKAPVLGFKIRHFVAMPNSEYCVVLSEKDRSVTRSYLSVYHIPTKRVVRKSELNSLPGVMKAVGQEEVLFVTDTRKLKLVNVNTMKVTKVFEGGLSYFTKDVEILKQKKEILTQTRGRMKFKLYDMTTGKTKAVLKRPDNVIQDKCFQSLFHVNKTGTYLAGLLSDGPWLIFDLEKQQCIQTISPSIESFRASNAAISNDGTRFLYGNSMHIKSPGVASKSYKIKSFVLWDLNAENKIKDCFDKDKQAAYFERENRRGIDVALDGMYVLNDDRILTTHDDFIMRVWDVKTGDLLKRLHGHKSSTKVFKIDSSPYFGSFEEQNIIRIWDRSTLDCIASYSLDVNVVSNAFCVDGKTFISSTKSPNARLIHWRLQGTNDGTTANGHSAVFTGNPVLNLKLDLASAEDGNDSHNDPDTDSSDDEKGVDDDDDEDFDDYNGLIW